MTKKKRKAVVVKPGPRMGTCAECGKGCYLKDEYLVRGEVWREAGMDGWKAGYLHSGCLELRLGRKLTRDDYLMIQTKWDGKGLNHIAYHSDYLTSPEYLDTINRSSAQGVIIYPHDRTVMGNYFRKAGFFERFKVITIGPTYTHMDDGEVEEVYTSPVGLYDCIIRWEAGGEWSMMGDMVFEVVPGEEEAEHG